MKLNTTFLIIACSLFVVLGNDSETASSLNEQARYTNQAAVEWNRMAYTVAYQHDKFYSFIGVRALSMAHIAMHDALNSIDRKYEHYAFFEPAGDADPIVSLSQVAYEVLAEAYPLRTDTLQAELQKWLAAIPDGERKEKGIELGRKSAETIIALREGDGHEKNGDYTPMTKPGDYQYTPGYDWVWKPDFDYARPFALDSLTQFRSPPPPPLNSSEYAASYREVKEFGSAESVKRSEDQTAYAHWWAEFGEHSWNRIGRLTAAERNLPLWETARMFALINMSLYDLYLVSFDSKYLYDTWRPYTAIREGDRDGNPDTAADPDWEPEMVTPPWPEYPSAHAAVGASGVEIVAFIYGTADVPFTMESTSALPGYETRTYTNLDDAANDCADSRIMNGYHFRFATEEGKRQGRAVARHVANHVLTPIQGR